VVSPPWGRKETLNEKLLREGGYSPEGTAIEESNASHAARLGGDLWEVELHAS
jgi:hypothetical protein